MNTFVEYIWIGGNNELRSKTKVIYQDINGINKFNLINDIFNNNVLQK